MVAATCFMLGSPLLDQVRVGRPTFASLWLVAAALLVAGSIVDAPRLWKGALLGLVLFGALLTDFQIALFCGVWLVVYGVARFRRRHLAALAVGGVVSLVPFAVIFLPALVAGGYPRPTSADMVEYSFRIWDFLDPTVLPHALGFELAAVAVLAVVLPVAASADVAVARRRRGVSGAGARAGVAAARGAVAVRAPQYLAADGAVPYSVPHGHAGGAGAVGAARTRIGAAVARPLGPGSGGRGGQH